MQVPMNRCMALLLTAALAACETNVTGSGIAGGTSAVIRVVNATASSVDVATAGTVAIGNAGLAFGAASNCTTTDATAPNLTVRTSGTGTVLAGFSPVLGPGGRYLAIAYSDANGLGQFSTFVTNTFIPASGQSGLKVIDTAPGTGNFDVYAGAPGSALGTVSATNLSFGVTTAFLNVNAGAVQVRLTNAGTQTIVFTAASQTLASGRNYVLVIGPPAAGTSGLRSFLVSSC